MFDMDKLLLEVQRKECVWNSRSRGYNDKVARKAAWEEIGLLFYNDWNKVSTREKDARIEYLVMKWRNVRDYYLRTKKRDNWYRGNANSIAKKKKYYYYDKLRFLDVLSDNKQGSNSEKEDVGNSEKEDVGNSEKEDVSIAEGLEDNNISNDLIYEQCFIEEDSNENPFIKEEEGTSPKAITSPLALPLEKDDSDLNVTANQNFLLSLLPDMTSLNERQNMAFRIGVLNLLNNIKFESTD